MPYASDNWVGTTHPIEITFEQYQGAVQGMMEGYTVRVIDGELVLVPPNPEE